MSCGSASEKTFSNFLGGTFLKLSLPKLGILLMLRQVFWLGSPGQSTQQVHDLVQQVELVDRGEQRHSLVHLSHQTREGPNVRLLLDAVPGLPGGCTAGCRKSFREIYTRE